MNMQIYEEASEWMILHRSDGLDADAKRRFDAWLRESPHHLRAYLEMSTIWEDVPALSPEWNAAADELIARAREDTNVVPLGEPSGSALRPQASDLRTLPSRTQASGLRPRYFFSIAAVLLATIGTAWLLYAQRGVYLTDIGEQRTLALEDGSSVELNARTKIRVRYSAQQRTIELLQGQALFRVAKDPSRPFVVDSNGTHVRAVGTQFDVYQKTGGTLVTVVEGRVAVVPAQAGTQFEKSRAQRAQDTQASGLSTQALVNAGEQLMISAVMPSSAAIEQVTLPVAKLADIEVATAWTQQRLIFDFTPLTEVAEEFNRYNRRPLVIDDPSLEMFNVSGSFSSTDPTLLLRFLREQPGIAVHETAGEIRISRQGAGTGQVPFPARAAITEKVV